MDVNCSCEKLCVCARVCVCDGVSGSHRRHTTKPVLRRLTNYVVQTASGNRYRLIRPSHDRNSSMSSVPAVQFFHNDICWSWNIIDLVVTTTAHPHCLCCSQPSNPHCVSVILKGDMQRFFTKLMKKVVSNCLLQYKPTCVINFDKLHRKKAKKRTSLVVFLV